MYTVELLLDPDLEQGVRECWARLHEAGMPSLATHRHPTNRPHLTLVTTSSLADLPPMGLPLATALGPVRVLGRALVRDVTATESLRDLQARLWRTLPDSWPAPPQWTPHVTLALNLTADRRAAALDLLGSLPTVQGRFVAARTYDAETRTVVILD